MIYAVLGLAIFGGYTLLDFNRMRRAGMEEVGAARRGDLPRRAEHLPVLPADVRRAPVKTPQALVLGGGGILGEAWMNAVLAGLDEVEGFDSRACEQYLGTSAGSIVAAALVGGIAPAERFDRPPEAAQLAPPEHDARDGVFGQAFVAAAGLGNAAAAPLASLALSSGSAGGAILRRAALRRVPAGRRSLVQLGRAIEAAGVRWDGRLRIAAVDLQSGRRVMFGAAGAPEVSVAAAVQASCAIPGVFTPMVAAGRSYVDGGVWSPTNADAAEVARGSRLGVSEPHRLDAPIRWRAVRRAWTGVTRYRRDGGAGPQASRRACHDDQSG